MIDEYDFRIMRMRFKELCDEVSALRRALDALRAMVEKQQCQDR